MPTLSTTETNTFAYTGAEETVTVGVSGYYDITADGAQGGGNLGGLGAMASGEIYLQAGETLELVVGGGTNLFGLPSADGVFGGDGGGGGSFVFDTGTTSTPLATPVAEVIAGGGGGGVSVGSGGAITREFGGGAGRTQATGGAGFTLVTASGAPGAGGVDGAAGQGATSGGSSGGGGGGYTGGAGGESGSVTGATFAGSSAGATNAGSGGFGGGGGGGVAGGGGGGGGYGGGGGGEGLGGGGGGGSFVNSSATVVSKLAGANSGNGLITISFGYAPTITGARSTTYANEGSITDTPFAGVTIGDNNSNSPTDTLTIELSDANASLAYGGQTLTVASPGAYTLTGSAAAITSELDALTLIAPSTLTGATNGVEAVSFALSDVSTGFVGAATTASTTADILAPTFDDAFSYTGSVQTFTVQTSGYYDIGAVGGQGGAGDAGIGETPTVGGAGASASGEFYFAAGAQLEIVVGAGGYNGGTNGGGGGGGGSFVIETGASSGQLTTPIDELIAGGGGGAGSKGVGGGARTQGTGGAGSSGGAGGVGGAAGQGGTIGNADGGGGGFTGGAGGAPGESGGASGASFAGGAYGLGPDSAQHYGAPGGFGGGGGASAGGGGGGGYGGGGGGGNGGGGGGGGSFVDSSAISESKTAGAVGGANNTVAGNGSVTIAPAVAPTITGAGSSTYGDLGSTTYPFEDIQINDSNTTGNPTDTLTLTLSDPSASLVAAGAELTDITGVGATFAGGAGVYTLTGPAGDMSFLLQGLALSAPASLPAADNGFEALNISLVDVSSDFAQTPTKAAVTADIFGPPSGYFVYTGNIQTFTVQTSGDYDITAAGAQGGKALSGGGGGGLGAMASGEVYLQAGAKLEIVVGGVGEDGSLAGGGGGGSFVIETDSGSAAVLDDEVIAGGGGGGGKGPGAGAAGGGGRTQGTGGGGGGVGAGAGGVAGAAGQGVSGSGGGGGGFTGGGAGGFRVGASGQSGKAAGTSFAGGTTNGLAGGFGGGGGGSLYAGGGGGGFGGGGGGGYSSTTGGGGGGGGSFVNASGTDVSKVAATHTGSGLVTIVLEDAACYVRGARILTARGEIAVEDLAVGDLVVTASEALRPIRWIGWRGLDCARHPNPAAVRPVRVLAHAFGEGLPHRDLWLSPGHNIAFEGALMPISALVNGASIVQERRERVEYWHVELDAHDVIFAEGLPAESYLDCGNRAAFVNGGAFIEAHPDFAPRHWAETCLPLVSEGCEVEAARALLRSRFANLGFVVTTEADAHLLADGRRIEPIRLGARRLGFRAPPESRALVLRSRSFLPAYSSLANADRRELGLSVARLWIDGVELALDDPRLQAGWRDCEREGGRPARRWTDGAARLPQRAERVLIELAGDGLYWRRPEAPVAAGRAEAASA